MTAPTHAGRHAAAALRVGGFVPFSALDCPGEFAAVVFVQGCPWRCSYCHNPHLQPRTAKAQEAPDWAAVEAWLQRRVGLIDSVVFSGGEPTADPALAAAVAAVRELGFRVGLHTAGIYPARLASLLPALDWVGLDVKAPLHDAAAHGRIVGLRANASDSTAPVRRSLALLAASGVAYECRTTAHPALLDGTELLRLAGQLAAAGVRNWALQIFRATGCASALAPVSDAYPDATTLNALRAKMPGFILRRH